MEESLKDETAQIDMTKQLKRIGCSDYKDAVKLMMKRLFTTNFMSGWNLKVTGGKFALKPTNVFKLKIEHCATS